MTCRTIEAVTVWCLDRKAILYSLINDGSTLRFSRIFRKLTLLCDLRSFPVYFVEVSLRFLTLLRYLF